MFSVTDNAAKQIRQAAEQSEAQNMALRIAAKANQDGSIEYGMGFDDPKENDIRVAADGVEILIDPPSNELLEEATLDYVEIEPGEMRFIFMNPLDPHYVPPKRQKKDKP